MIGIKGMELPKSCNNCRFCVIATTVNDLDILCGVNTDIDTVRGFISSRHPNCKLVNLGKEDMSEDMSWKELKKFAKDEIVFEYKSESLVYFEIDSPFFLMKFYKDGDIYFNDTKMLENKKPFEMWQIIKALVGEK